jgi:membrane-associated phospholipid phosphatase
VPSTSCFTKATSLATIMVLAGAVQPAHAGSTQARIGDVLSVAIPLATAGTEWYRGQHEGAIQYTEALALSVGATEVLKYTVHSERPDHSDSHSFPSLHATAAFSAATYVNRRYGFVEAAPLYALATYVGYTRVQAHEHRWSDVAGSALLTGAASWWLVDPSSDQRVTILPMIDRHAVGISLAARW